MKFVEFGEDVDSDILTAVTIALSFITVEVCNGGNIPTSRKCKRVDKSLRKRVAQRHFNYLNIQVSEGTDI